MAFSELIERGMISPGTKLVDSKKRHGALVRADGAIMLGDKVGSIHRIGAVAQGSGACNALDLLARRDQQGSQADRRDARRNPLGDGGGLEVSVKPTTIFCHSGAMRSIEPRKFEIVRSAIAHRGNSS